MSPTVIRSLSNRVTDALRGSLERIAIEGQNAAAYLSYLLRSLGGINVAQHVDVDGIRPESGLPSTSPQYMQTVEKARSLVRSLEAATQALYDDGMTLFMVVQQLARTELLGAKERATLIGSAESTAPTVRSNCVLVAQTPPVRQDACLCELARGRPSTAICCAIERRHGRVWWLDECMTSRI